ncbi:MAG: adenine deaminase [Planctomycetaceae bacterium]|nr:adenine deaminase [Planctomycetaceae bacterium]
MSSPATDFQVSGNLIDIHERRIVPVTVSVQNGRIAGIAEEPHASYDTFLAPGFVDAHIHIESSMLPPSEFSRLATPHGTVATVSDPHEIANVLGVAGVEWMLADAAFAAVKIHFGAPSCVPATPFDHAGAELGVAETEQLLARRDIHYFSEMMDYPGVVAGRDFVLAKLAAARAAGKPIDGHAPGLRGRDLATYVAAGIVTDHECFTLDEAREKQSLGMKILIREGSAAKNFAALWPLLREVPAACMFCSDDKHPNDLIEGHIDALVRRALAHGVDLFDVWRTASLHPVEHYRMNVGLLRPGDPADFLEVTSPTQPWVRRTWIDGRLVAREGVSLLPRRIVQPVNRFTASSKRPEDFALPAVGPQARIIEALDGQLITGECVRPVRQHGGLVVTDIDDDVLKIAVVDRFRNVPPAVALIRNFGLRSGAIAESVSHDSHHIVAVGVADEDLARSVKAVIDVGGGLSVATPTAVTVLPLPIAGLMSDADGCHVAAEYARLDAQAKALGSRLTAPFMTLSFMALLVIPKLKLSVDGLFDVVQFRHVGLWDV